MKITISLILLIIEFIYCLNGFQNNNYNNIKLNYKYSVQFIKWSHQYDKKYSSEEFRKRFQLFKQSVDFIEKTNEKNKKLNPTLVLGLNQFSDLSFQEFTNTKTDYLIPILNDPLPAPCGGTTLFSNFNQTFGNSDETMNSLKNKGWTRPASMDWRNYGAVSMVKNQGPCGSCYAFAASSAMESMYFRKYNNMKLFSEQNLVDCTLSYGNGGCSGGWMHNCYKYVKDNGGLNSQSIYPYQGTVGKCRYTSSDSAVKVTNYVMVKQHNENDLADIVGSIGPVSAAFDASTIEFMYYHSGIYYSENCNKYRTSAAALVIGYGSENGVDYWILKNSWGVNWGEGGFFKMRRNIDDACGIATASSYPIIG
ncbi:hypothetical protein ACTA71_010735 [Dictyostelium dimigraforme]